MNAIDFRSLFEAVPELCIVLTPELKIVAITDAHLAATFAKREEILGRYLFDVFPESPDDAGEGRTTLLNSLQMVLQKKTVQDMPVIRYDVLKPDGTFQKKFWTASSKPLFNEQQEVQYILTHAQDVTERIQREDLFFYVFEENPACLTISHLENGVILNVNKMFLSVFGFEKKEDVIGKTAVELKLIRAPEERRHIMDSIKAGKPITGMEGMIHLPDGSIKCFSNSVQLVEINNEHCLLTAMLDITKRKEQENLVSVQSNLLKQANEELETFSYSVSHDLKAPLRSLEGFSKLLLENYTGKFDADADRWLKFIAANANRMGVLINDILSFSRISRSMVNKVHVNMQALVDSTFETEKINYSHHVIEFHASTLVDTYGDIVMLGQVWQNLISNALKYSSKNEHIVITVTCESDDHYNRYSITDNGVGFDEKYKDKLFGVFQRLHRSDEFEGTGVGLAIVNRIIQKHEGWISASSTIGKGSTFTIALPKQKNNVL
ncbi:MAG TPA: ATP-binding protein [Cytophagaceae bacterium]|jgi:PAS domain S-box-containing protein|nr:ATP-binding protein [Cytophagaceae bacterium]